jgi:hypothetical protein
MSKVPELPPSAPNCGRGELKCAWPGCIYFDPALFDLKSLRTVPTYRSHQIYHSEHCKEQARRETWRIATNRRTFIKTAGPAAYAITAVVRDEIESLFERLRAGTRGARHTEAFTKLKELRDELVNGAHLTQVRKNVRLHAAEIRRACERRKDSDDLEAQLLYIQSGELLMQPGTGWDMDPAMSLREYITYGRAAMNFYREIREPKLLLRASIETQNFARLDGNDALAREIARGAYHEAEPLLRRRLHLHDPELLVLLHEVVCWHFRHYAGAWLRGGPSAQIRLLHELAGHIAAELGEDHPSARMAQVENHRILATHFLERGELGTAGEHVEALRPLVDVEGQAYRRWCPQYLWPSLIRNDIDFCIEADRDQAVYLVEEVYLPLYQENRHKYFHGFLEVWRGKLGLSFEIPSPLYQTAQHPPHYPGSWRGSKRAKGIRPTQR